MVAAGADAVGLVFYKPSPRAVTIEQAKMLCRYFPPFVTVTALFVDESADTVREVLDQVPVDLLQFHGNESADYCQGFGRPYIKALRVRAEMDLHAEAAGYSSSRGLLLDAYQPGVPGGTGETFDWDLIPDNLDTPVVLAGGLNPGNVAEAVTRVRPFAVDVSGGVEAAKGIKDSQLVAKFIHEVSCADRR